MCRVQPLVVGIIAALISAGLAAQDAPPAPAPAAEGPKALSGMSVLGNSEAPKSLVIVPWKSSEIGDGIGVANLLDEHARPVDKDVFARQISFYELRKGSAPGGLAPDSVGGEVAADL